VRTIRNARNEYNVEAGRKIGALVRLSSSSPSSAVFAELLETEGTYIHRIHVHCRCRCIITIRREPVARTDATECTYIMTVSSKTEVDQCLNNA
jgi:type IV secretory pathway component VirB8